MWDLIEIDPFLSSKVRNIQKRPFPFFFKVDSVVKKGMKKSIAELYKGDLSQEPVSLAWNSLHIEV